eukprot:1222419-Alexandrium_andersonii.AAC.1
MNRPPWRECVRTPHARAACLRTPPCARPAKSLLPPVAAGAAAVYCQLSRSQALHQGAELLPAAGQS